MTRRTPLQICQQCDRRQRPCSGPCACTLDGREIVEHAAAADCPLGRHQSLPIADLTGYDPETDPQSPKHGSCCDPPKG